MLCFSAVLPQNWAANNRQACSSFPQTLSLSSSGQVVLICIRLASKLGCKQPGTKGSHDELDHHLHSNKSYHGSNESICAKPEKFLFWVSCLFANLHSIQSEVA